jgi:DNA-binding beta-propeller fold protein YncE
MRPNRPTLMLCALTLFAGLFVCDSAIAQNEGEEAAAVTAKVLVTNLLNPSGLAIQEGTGHVFIANRHGVYRYLPAEKDRTKRIAIEIHTPGNDVYGKGPKYDVGPLGVAFIDGENLVVGDGSRKDGAEFVRVYKVGTESPAEAAKEDSAVHTLGPITMKEGVTAKGEGNFYGVAVGGGAIFVTCNGDDTKGWVSKSMITDGKPGELLPTIATKEATSVDAPVAITFSPDGKDLVVGQMGEMTVPGDSLLTIYDPATGKLKKSYKTGLSDIAGLAYSPKTGKLYATDFSWADTAKGGLFELTIDGDEVKATLVLKLDKPTAVAFDKDGNLFVTEFGSAAEGGTKNPGSLSIIKAGL